MDAQAIIARRIALELRDGMLVNLGVGIPTLVANFVPKGIHVYFQSENGLIGTGPVPEPGMALAWQVDQRGRLANWTIPGKMVPGMGGAMDLVAGARRVIVAMQHTAKGRSKIVRECTLPLTSDRPVDLVVTELAVIGFPGGRATLLETAEGVTIEQVLAATEAELAIPRELAGSGGARSSQESTSASSTGESV